MGEEFDPIVWVDDLPPQGGRSRELAWFAEQLRKQPGKWAVLPGNRKHYGNQIKSGKLKAFPAGEFDAVSRRPLDGDIALTYVRFIGEGVVTKMDDVTERRRQRLEG